MSFIRTFILKPFIKSFQNMQNENTMQSAEFKTVTEEWNPRIDPEELRKQIRHNKTMASFCNARLMSEDEIKRQLRQKALNRKTSGLFVSKGANEWIDEALRRPDPIPLWKNLWFEEEVACLFADTNMGKSILAVQIADDISRRGRRVMYFDFELSDKQFQIRYQDGECGRYGFAPTFIRAEFSQNNVPDSIEEIVSCIEDEVIARRCKIVIIDNITWICNRSESGDAAGALMQELVSLKRDYGLSVLVLAHTPKRAMSSRLTQNSLAGSKRIANFMDSIFAIGKAPRLGSEWRYIKQIKTRSAEMLHGADNVIVACLCRENNRLSLVHVDTDREDNLIEDEESPSRSRGITPERRQQVIELSQQGKSQNEIARELKMSKRDVSRIINGN